MSLRTFALVLVAAASVLLVGRGLVAQEKTPIVLWHAYRGVERDALEKTVAQFNSQSKGIQVETLAVPFDALPDKISAAVPRGKGPDLFIFAHDRIGNWAESSVVEPINFYLQQDKTVLNRFYKQTLEPLIYRGSLYGMPLAYKSTALYYNKALVPTPPKTTDELIAFGKKAMAGKAGTYGLVYENSNFYYHAAWMHGFGARLFNDNGDVTFNTPEMAASFQFAADLKTVHGIIPAEVTNTLVTSLFNDGKAAMVISGPWFSAELKKGLGYAVAPLPVVSATGKAAAPFLGAEALMMSAKSAHKAEAYEVMAFLTDGGPAKVRLTEGRQTVATISAYEGVSDPFITAFQTQLQNTVPMSNSPKMLAVWTPVTNVCGKVIGGRGTPTDSVAEGQKAIEAAIAASSR